MTAGWHGALNLSGEELSRLDEEEIERIDAVDAFVRNAMPNAWLDHAAELKESAEVLWVQMDEGMRIEAELTPADTKPGMVLTQEPKRFPGISRPYILLAGFALENLFKGLLVAQDPSHINTGKLSKELKSHNLLELAAKLKGLSLSRKERRVCEVLQDALPYWGRYPIPLSYKRVSPELPVDNEFRQVFLHLFDRMGKKLHQMIRNGWDSQVGPKVVKVRDIKFGDRINLKEPFVLEKRP